VSASKAEEREQSLARDFTLLWMETNSHEGRFARPPTYDEQIPLWGYDSVMALVKKVNESGGKSECEEERNDLTLQGFEPSPFEGGGDDVGTQATMPSYRSGGVAVLWVSIVSKSE
jgi:hypothetical protein